MGFLPWSRSSFTSAVLTSLPSRTTSSSERPSKRNIQDRYKSSSAINSTPQIVQDEKCDVNFGSPEDITHDALKATPEQPTESSSKQSSSTTTENPKHEKNGTLSLQGKRNDDCDDGDSSNIYDNDDDSHFDTRSSRPNTAYTRSERKREVKLSWKRLILLFVFLVIFPIFPIVISAANVDLPLRAKT